ncbi:MAG TPA: hypothetical protein V6D05_17745 [Stenomitos sp.]
MTCTTAHQLIQEALDLPGTQQPALDAHLATCAACRSYQEGMRRLARDLSDSTSESAPSALMDRLGLTTARRHSGRRWLPLGIVAAGLLLVTVVGPRLTAMTPGTSSSPAVVADLPEESILGYFDPGDNSESDQLPF